MTRTNAYSILCVFTRAFAMWIFVATLVGVVATFNTARLWDSQLKWVYFLGGTGLPMAVSVLVWIFADKLAKVALARPQQMVFESDIASYEWQTVAFSVVGLWQAFGGIIGLTTHLAGMLAAAGTEPWPPRFVGNLAASCVQLLLGVSLLFGARGLVGIVRQYRQIGYTSTASSEVASNEADDRNSAPPPAD